MMKSNNPVLQPPRYLFLALVFVLMILALLSCNGIEESIYTPELNVYSVLRAYDSYHTVVVDRTYKMDEPSGFFIDDALVTISRGSVIDTLIWDGSQEPYGAYTTYDLSIYPGTTYELVVVKEGMDTLFGNTTIPGRFDIITPGDTVTLEDTVRFTPSSGAVIYLCGVINLNVYKDEYFWLKPASAVDTVSIRLGDYIGTLPSGYCAFGVVAYDSNYYKYTFEPDDSLWRAGVTGGVGLFGSAWNETAYMYLEVP